MKEALKRALDWFEKDGEPDHHPVVDAIKEALAQPEQEPVAWMQPDEVHISLWKDEYHTIPLYTRPQNPQRSEDINLSCKSTQARLAASWGYVKAQPEQRSVSEQQEPVAWQDTAKPTELVSAEDWDNIDPQWHWMYRPLYTTPPQHSAIARKPLTDEQERKAFEDYAVRTICNPVELQRGRLGGYTSQELNYLWRGWKARAAHGIKE